MPTPPTHIIAPAREIKYESVPSFNPYLNINETSRKSRAYSGATDFYSMRNSYQR